MAGRIAGLAHFQEAAENMMAWAHYYLRGKEEIVEGSKDEGCLVAIGHIPQAVTTLMEVFGIDQMDLSVCLCGKGKIIWPEMLCFPVWRRLRLVWIRRVVYRIPTCGSSDIIIHVSHVGSQEFPLGYVCSS